MSENRICKLPCTRYKPDGPTDLGVGGWCLEHHHPCLLVECQRRDIIEAVLEGDYSTMRLAGADGETQRTTYQVTIPTATQQFAVRDKPCPTCGGRGTYYDSSKDEYFGCHDCGDDHFIPGKGKGM